MKKEKDVDPTIHYAALSWFYLLYVFSKRIVYNLTTCKKYPTALHKTSQTLLSSWQEVLGGSLGRQQLPGLTAMGENSALLPGTNILLQNNSVSWPSPAWKHMVSFLLSLFKRGNFSDRKLLSKAAAVVSVQCRWHLPSLCSQVYLCLHTTICFRLRYFHLFSNPQISNHWNWSPTIKMLKETLKIDLYQRKKKNPVL